jgi:hypothetical protein
MPTAEEIVARVQAAVARRSAAAQALLEIDATRASAAAELRAADAELDAARAVADEEIEIASGRKPRPDPPN